MGLDFLIRLPWLRHDFTNRLELAEASQRLAFKGYATSLPQMSAVRKTYSCYFYPDDKDKRIDRKYWGVTLFASAGIGLTKHHAQLLIEKVKRNGKYEKIIAHFMGGGSSRTETSKQIEGSWCSSGFGKIGRVQIIRKPEISKHGKPIKHSGHTETWIRESSKVRKMWRHIKKEEKNPITEPVAFSIFGNRSHLAPKIYIYKFRNEITFYAYKTKPILFNLFYFYVKENLCDIENYVHLANRVHSGKYETLQSRIADERRRRIGLFVVSGLTYFFGPKSLSAVVSETAQGYKEHNAKEKDLFRYLEIKAKAKEAAHVFCTSISTSSDDASLKKEDELVQDILLSFFRNMKVKLVERNSCCTWAMNKISLADITFERLDSDLIITDTRKYLKDKKVDK